jgi:hypothetical protein
MSKRYEVSMGELLVVPPAAVGSFAVTFVVKPPIEIISSQAGQDLSRHVLKTFNALQDYEERIEESAPGTLSDNAKISFTHHSADGEATLGTMSGFSNHRINTDVLSKALDIVLNGSPE